MSIEDDPVLGRFFDTPEKRAKWIVRIKIVYLIWIIFLIIGITSIALWHLLK